MRVQVYRHTITSFIANWNFRVARVREQLCFHVLTLLLHPKSTCHEKSSCVKLGLKLFEGVLLTLYIIAVYASYLFNGPYLELFSIKKLDNTKYEGVRVNLFNFCRDGFRRWSLAHFLAQALTSRI